MINIGFQFIQHPIFIIFTSEEKSFYDDNDNPQQTQGALKMSLRRLLYVMDVLKTSQERHSLTGTTKTLLKRTSLTTSLRRLKDVRIHYVCNINNNTIQYFI